MNAFKILDPGFCYLRPEAQGGPMCANYSNKSEVKVSFQDGNHLQPL